MNKKVVMVVSACFGVFLTAIVVVFIVTIGKIGIGRSWQLLRVAMSSDEKQRQGLDRLRFDYDQGSVNKLVSEADGGSRTLAGILTKTEGKHVTIWSLKGERTFVADDNAEWMYYDVCSPYFDPQGGAPTLLTDESWMNKAKKGYVQVWVQGWKDGERVIFRAMAFSGFPFVTDNQLKCRY